MFFISVRSSNEIIPIEDLQFTNSFENLIKNFNRLVTTHQIEISTISQYRIYFKIYSEE